jgi:MSHA biogenesis protein MshJ
MIERLGGVRDWFEALSFRERVAIVAAVLIGLLLGIEALAWAPARKRLDGAEAQIASLDSQRTTLQQELDKLDQEESLDPDAAVKRQLKSFDQQVGTLDKKLEGQALQLIDPAQARPMLQALISNVHGLRLLSLHTEPPTQLVNTENADLPPLYRHGIVIELEGDYLPLLDYLQALENLPWRLYWYGLDVKADKPGARHFRLEFYTVSLRKEWIRA